jgi:hypothetical protein
MLPIANTAALQIDNSMFASRVDDYFSTQFNAVFLAATVIGF